MIVGLTGKNASGKGEAAKYLEKKGFIYYSLSDEIRTEISNRGIEISRELLIETGNELRNKYGADILARRIMERLNSDKNYIVDSIRNPAEIKALKERPDFVLLNIIACENVRFERIKSRCREGDPQTLEQFISFENREINNKDENVQQVDNCEKLADEVISNNTNLEEFYIAIDDFLKKGLMFNKRPGWDEYFMKIASVVAMRSNCMKRKVAAIIVKDKRIISTGYNGTPRGTKNCNEGGCPRCNSLSSSGENLGECLCSHGEENAIVQAAYHGVSVKDSTIYTTFSPCLMCSKMIINSGIKEVVYNIDYPLSQIPINLLKEAGMQIRQIKL